MIGTPRHAPAPAERGGGRQSGGGRRARSITRSYHRPEDAAMAERTTHYTSNHTEIRRWAKRHGARPGIARDTIASRDLDQLTLVLPGERGEENVEFIDWDEFFRRFDEEEMVFVYEERKAPRKRVKPPRVHLLIPSRIILERQRAIAAARPKPKPLDRKSTRLNSSHVKISYAVFC